MVHDVYEHAQEKLPPSFDEEEFQECQEFNTDKHMEPPTDDLLDFITIQDHSDDQLDQVLQTYQAYQQTQSETETSHRQMNARITYHVAQANQAKHGSLVDRGANGGLAGSDVRVLSISSRKCTVTGIDNHEIPGLEFVQCASLVQTNHGMVNLIMNEYAYYGRGHMHSSGQIERYTNIVDDKSVQVGGQQRIVTIDGHSMPLICKGKLMYLELQGIPTDKDLQTYPLFILKVLMNGIHPYWTMNTLKTMGSLIGPLTQNTFNLIPILMNLVIMSIDHCPFLTY